MNKFKITRLPIYYQAWLVGGFFCVVLFISIIFSVFTTPNTRENHELLTYVNKVYRDIYLLSGFNGLKQKLNTLPIYQTKLIIVNSENQKLYTSKSSWNLPSKIMFSLLKSKNSEIKSVTLNQKSNLISDLSFNYIVNEMHDNNRIIVVQRVTGFNSELNQLSWKIWLFLLIFFFVGLGGIYIGLFVKRRLVNINNSCKLIIEKGDLSQRVPRDGSNKDFDLLAKNLNHMLSHIEQLITDIRQVSDNISHDLRTPLTKLQNKLEGFRRNPLCDQEIENFHQELQNDISVMNSIFNALLRISRIESFQNKTLLHPINIDELLKDAVEFYQPLAEEKNQIISLNSYSAKMIGDKDLLFQAIINCIENAIKYTPAKGEIVITIEKEQTQLKISISDNGSGIPINERVKVFQRLYRLDKSRATPGNGLGLSLVKAIVEYHHGTIKLKDNFPGVIIELAFPINV